MQFGLMRRLDSLDSSLPFLIDRVFLRTGSPQIAGDRALRLVPTLACTRCPSPVKDCEGWNINLREIHVWEPEGWKAMSLSISPSRNDRDLVYYPDEP